MSSFERSAKASLAEGSDHAGSSASEGGGSLIARHLDGITDWAVALSALPFLVSMLPQIITDFQEPSEVRKLPWAGTASGCLGNLLLLSFFTAGGEMKQALIQAVGVLTSMFVVCQIAASRGPDGEAGIPMAPFLTLLAITSVGLVMPGLRACGLCKRAFELWITLTTVVGTSSFFFSVSNQVVDTMHLDDDDLLIRGVAAGVGFLLGLVVLATGRAGGSVGGALATALLMFQPLPQLVGNLVDPATKLATFNVSYLYLGTLGNGLGMSRAIFTRNWVWMAGAIWGCYVGGVLSAMTVVVGSHQLATPKLSPSSELLLVLFMALFVLYTVVFLSYDREAQRLKGKASSARECLAADGCSSDAASTGGTSPGVSPELP